MKNTKKRKKILSSLRVLEVSHAIAGPTAGQVLADYGAEVIKIERPGYGDIFRNVPGMGPTMFLAINRGKKSLALDLKKKDGLSIFYKLVRRSDVIIENLGPGVAESIGVTYARAERANPRVIYCKIESFGEGPYENVPAFDPILQAATGIMSTTGFPPDHYGRAGVSIVDMSSGFHAAIGILSLLLRSEKSSRGAELRVSLYDAASYYMSYWIALFDLFGKNTVPLGSGHIFGSPYNLFKTKNGFVYIGIASDVHWVAFCRSLEFADLSKNEKYQAASERVRLKQSLETDVAQLLSQFENEEIESKLKDSGVPFGVFNTVESLLRNPHFLSRELISEYHYESTRYRTTVNPAVIDGGRVFTSRNPPKLGENSDEVLREILKLSKSDLNRLREKQVIA